MSFLNLVLFHVLGGNFGKIDWNIDGGWNRTEFV